MDTLARIEGPGLVLRLIEPEDAAYVHGLRTDPAYNRHLSEVSGTAEDQRRWIESYKAREAKRTELYYVIERRDGLRCGLVRLYDIQADHFTWGSWILDANKPFKAALESAALSFGVGFERLDKPLACVDVRHENTHATHLYRRFGMVETRRDKENLYFEYPRDRYRAELAGYLSPLNQKEKM